MWEAWMLDTRKKVPVVAIAGQPNTGKSTLFNALTGLTQAVGNWPGKTVERKSGTILCGSTKVEIVDLPGTYSLTADSAEERIARDFIIDGHADLVLVVVNALCLDRTLYYGAEIAAMGIPYVVALNMTDMAEDAGITVDSSRVAQGLGTPVFPLVASRGKGIEQLRAGLEQALSSLNRSQEGIGWLSGEMMALHRDLADEIIPLAKTRQRGAWDALKLMEGDPEARQDLAVKDRGVLEWADSRLAGFPMSSNNWRKPSINGSGTP